ncbi:MAG: hypothetical protein NTZ26_02965 [Candidatus Aminicenantes bacterium]|nr:hypothetical protein [Candidatus Aminicenantes bacterium]
MDAELGKLIEKLKSEGVEEGRRIGREKTEAAEKAAAAILDEARSKAADILQLAENQAEMFRVKSETAVQQAARDIRLLLKARIMELFERAFKTEIAAALRPELVRDLILKVVEDWSEGGGIELSVADQDLTAIKGLLGNGLQKLVEDGVVLKTGASLRHGFRVALKGRDVFVDFTDETLGEALFSLLKPQLRALLDGTGK